jgi:hypothetical protein
MNIFFKKYYLLLFSLLLSIAYFLFVYETIAEYSSFETLKWTDEPGCLSFEPGFIDGTSSVLKFDFNTGHSESLRCSSEPFHVSSSVLRIHYSHSNVRDPVIWLVQNGVPISEFRLESSDTSIWSILTLDLPHLEVGKEFAIMVAGEGGGESVFYIRNRMEFLSRNPSSLHLGFQELSHTTIQKSLILGTSLFFLLLYIAKSSFVSTGTYFILLFFSSVLFFFSKSPFYYFDEWHVLQRFAETGFSGIWSSHNEHFLPIFFAWYYMVTSVFGEYYEALLFLSLVLHALHGIVILMLMQEFAFSRKVSQIIIYLYSLSALHLEVLEWAFEQSIILCSIFGLLGIIFGSKYLRTGKFRYIFLSAFLCSCAPLIFGNGFTWIPVSLILLCSSILLLDESAIRTKLIRLCKLGFLQCVLVLPAVYMYLQNKASNAPSDSRGAPFVLLLEKFDQVINYIIVGSGVGTVLRGLSVYPNLSLSSLKEVLSSTKPFLVPYLDRLLLFSKSFEFHMGLAGYILLFIIFLCSLKKEYIKRASFSLLSCVVILFFFLFYYQPLGGFRLENYSPWPCVTSIRLY